MTYVLRLTEIKTNKKKNALNASRIIMISIVYMNSQKSNGDFLRFFGIIGIPDMWFYRFLKRVGIQ